VSIELTRRRALTAGAAWLAARGDALARDDEESLCGVARRNGLHFGAAVRIEDLAREHDLRGAVLRECTHLTPETAFKWDAIESSPGALSFQAADALLAFAVQQGLQIHGHTLLWHGATPAWAAHALLETGNWRLVQSHFERVLGRYGHAISHWDVINEPIETGYRMDGLRPSVFLRAFGPDYIPRALWEARQLAPRATLMINEFSLEYDTPVDRHRRYHFLKLLERLRHAGVPLDGVGLQSHLELAKGPFPAQAFAAFVREISDLGLFIVVSELDVKEHDYVAPVEQRDHLVADATARYLDVVLGHSAVRGVTTWGLSDRHSWLKLQAADFARYPAAWRDGSSPGANRGLPFDAGMRRKPMYRAIAGALSGAGSR
jgi:endo-1,4-beta-xylanase